MSEYLTIREVKNLLKVSERTVRRWITSGELPALKIGGSVRIRKGDIDMQTQGTAEMPPDRAAQDAVLQKARRLRGEIYDRQGGHAGSSVDILRKMRQERAGGR